MLLWEEWWVWMSAALLLATLEVLVPGYVFLGFAIGALGVGVALLAFISLGGFPLTMVVFAVLSLLAYLGMRRVFGLKTGSVKIWDRDINDN
jgi:membrane protein implicated in regulation of membrane protease activity